MGNILAQEELIKASKEGVTLTVLQLLGQGTDPNFAYEVDISCTILLDNLLYFFYLVVVLSVPFYLFINSPL